MKLPIYQQISLQKIVDRLKSGVVSRADAMNTASQLEMLEPTPFRDVKLLVYQTFINTPRADLGKLIGECEEHPFEGGSDEHIARKFLQLKENASSRGLEFSLTLEDVRDLMHTTYCEYSGVAFDSTSITLKRTVDRINCKRGYVKGNVVACTHAMNCYKNELLEMVGAPFRGRPEALVECIKKWGGIDG